MEQANNRDYPKEFKLGFFDIDPETVLEDARNKGLKVWKVEDFRDQSENYGTIEDLMTEYLNNYAFYNAIGGATTGIGGITTSITLSSFELANTATHLYRLSQQFAVLNGFDPEYPFHQDKVYNIYLSTLGFKAASQTALKYILFRVSRLNNDKPITFRLFSSVITRLARKVGSDISSRNVSKLIPFVGSAVGAYTSYNYAYDTGNSMRDAFKKLYYSDWHDTKPPEDNE